MTKIRRHRGFTLMEMVIAMTLLSILVTLLFASLKLAADSWNAGEHKMAEVNKKAVIYQFFKRHINTIRPLIISTKEGSLVQDGLNMAVFLGDKTHLRFAAPLPASAARKGLQVFEIAAVGDGLLNLQVGITPYFQTAGASPTEKVVILQQIRSFSFMYYGGRNEVEPASWYDTWSDTEILPRLIKVSIQLADQSYWPDMIFAIKVNALPMIDPTAPVNDVSGN